MCRIVSLGTFLIVLMAASCAAPGRDGKAFIAYSWVSGPITFSTNDPTFGNTIYNGQYLPASVGTWNFSYQAWDNSIWSGKYTVSKNPGTKGGLFSSGTDGDDAYFELSCLSIGPSFYKWSYARDLASNGDRIDAERKLLLPSHTETYASPNQESGWAVSDMSMTSNETITAGGYTVELTYQKVK